MNVRRLLLVVPCLLVAVPAAAALTFRLSNGIPVRLLPRPENTVVSIQLTVAGAALDAPQAAPGREALLFELMTLAGQDYTREALQTIKETAHLELSAFSENEGGGLRLRCLVEHKATALIVLGSLFRHPSFETPLIEETRTRLAGAIRQGLGDPFNALSLALQSRFLAAHPYRNTLLTDESAVTNTTRGDLVLIHRRLLDARRLSLVVAGPLDRAGIEGRLEAAFGSIRKDGYANQALPRIAPGAFTNLLILPHPAATTSYVRGDFAAPSPEWPDYPAYLLASHIYSEMISEEVRTRHGLAYGAWAAAPRLVRRPWASIAFFRCKDPVLAVTLAARLLGELRNGTGRLTYRDEAGRVVTDRAGQTPDRLVRTPLEAVLEGAKNQLITATYLRALAGMDQAASVAGWHLVSGDWNAAGRLAERIRRQTAFDVQQVAKRWFRDIGWGATGPARDLEGLPAAVAAFQ